MFSIILSASVQNWNDITSWDSDIQASSFRDEAGYTVVWQTSNSRLTSDLIHKHSSSVSQKLWCEESYICHPTVWWVFPSISTLTSKHFFRSPRHSYATRVSAAAKLRRGHHRHHNTLESRVGFELRFEPDQDLLNEALVQFEVRRECSAEFLITLEFARGRTSVWGEHSPR